MKTRFQITCLAGLCVALLLSIGATAAQAETVAYWRFEDSPGFLEDSGPNNMDLTIVDNGGGGPTQYTLPETGAGSMFPDPIPQTGEPNAEAAQMSRSKDGFSGSDNSALAFTSGFTIEAFFNRDYASYHKGLFRQWDGPNNERNVCLTLRKGAYGRVLELQLSETGADPEGIYSTLAYTDDKDYYMGVAVDLTAKEVTFYLQNLTDGGALQKETISCTTSSLHDSSADFHVGVYHGSENGSANDIIDEVRISNVALTEGELLVNVPEPSALALLASGLFGLLAYAWRKRK